MTRAVRLHLSGLVAVFFVLLAFGAWLRRAEHLLEPTALIFGGSYADVMGRMPASLVLVAVCVAGAALAVLQATSTRNWPIPAGRGPLRRGVGGRRGVQQHRPALRRRPQRADPRRALHPVQHRRDAPRVRARQRRGARALGRRAAHGGRHRPQRRDARERAAVGSPAAARNLRTDPGDSHLLRVRRCGQRPLPRRRQAAPGDAVGPRAQLGQSAQPHVGERAAHLHARLRPDARSGERGDVGRPARALRPGSAAGHDARVHHRRAQPLLRRDSRATTPSSRPAPASSTTRAATTTCSRSTTARAACRCRRSGASCSSRSGSAPTRWSSATTSAPRAASSSIATSASACARWRRSSTSTATPTWCWPRGGCSGSTTPTRPRGAIPTPRR